MNSNWIYFIPLNNIYNWPKKVSIKDSTSINSWNIWFVGKYENLSITFSEKVLQTINRKDFSYFFYEKWLDFDEKWDIDSALKMFNIAIQINPENLLAELCKMSCLRKKWDIKWKEKSWMNVQLLTTNYWSSN